MKNIFYFSIIAVIVILMASVRTHAKNENSGNPTIIANLATHDTDVKADIAELLGNIEELLAQTSNDEIESILNTMHRKLNMILNDSTCSDVEAELIQHVEDTTEALAEILAAVDNSEGGCDDGGFPCTNGGTEVGGRWVVSDSELTVCDKNSALTWEKHPISVHVLMQEAINHCSDLGPGWSIPANVSDLSFVINDVYPAAPGPFTNLTEGNYWTSEEVNSTGRFLVVKVTEPTDLTHGEAISVLPDDAEGILQDRFGRAWCVHGQ